ncbi:MAG: thiamine phosphate synthase [Candidatus Eremiobacteraeota bacterium]|nr:thiamine phosphate synthase [Candidatus Eremiobacteraeota bacterium]MBC5827638.1 thiamine phosphate synthase [Candidatus Eremiobacteraeota bacterium]
MDSTPRVAPLAAFLRAAIGAGVGMVQLRERRLTDAELLGAAIACAQLCRSANVPFIINDRCDIALLCGADGVHVGQDDVSITGVRSLIGPDRIVGLSTHSAAQIDAARTGGADYIGVGPVHATPTKEGRPAAGVELVRYATGHAAQPFFAIGGIDPSSIGEVISAGATRVSVLRYIAQAPDPARAVRDLVAEMNDIG